MIRSSSFATFWAMRSCTVNQARIFAHDACEFRESNDLLMTQAPDIGLADKRQNMVLAQRSEIDRPLDYLHRGNVLGAIHAFSLEDDLDIGIANTLRSYRQALEPIGAEFVCMARYQDPCLSG